MHIRAIAILQNNCWLLLPLDILFIMNHLWNVKETKDRHKTLQVLQLLFLLAIYILYYYFILFFAKLSLINIFYICGGGLMHHMIFSRT